MAAVTRSRISLFVLFAVPLVLLVLAPHAVLLSFAGMLLAVGLRGLSDPLALRLKIPDGLAQGIVVLVLALLLWALGRATALPLAEQANKLATALPETWNKLHDQLGHYRWAQGVLQAIRPQQLIDQPLYRTRFSEQ